MYTQFFRLVQAPFSISPDPRYLFMSERHSEALAHLLYGIDSGGGLVLLTGDIGTGKTTVCRCFLEQVPAGCNVAYIFNPKLTVPELLQSICEEFHIGMPDARAASVKDCIDALNRYLLASHAEGRNNVLVIDEAQNLSADVLEQLRLLTNLETNERKLLQIVLIGQPELRAMLTRPELEQLAQRVIAHYHLTALSEQETASYIQHRMTTAGLAAASPFQPGLMKQIHRLTRGVPRRINLLCDRALLGAYAKGERGVNRSIIEQAAGELFIHQRAVSPWPRRISLLMLATGLFAVGAAAWNTNGAALYKTVHAEWLSLAASSDMATETSTPVAAEASRSAFDQPAGIERNEILQPILRDEAAALRQLSRLWGAQAGDEFPCAPEATGNLRCYRSSGGLAELRQLDRPALLTLYDTAGKPFYAMLTGLGESSASVIAGDTGADLNLASLTRHFRGEFVTVWRAPPGFESAVKPGDTGPAADWIALQLARLDDVAPPQTGQPLNQTTAKRVRYFQQAQGLHVDGVVGPLTAMHLNRAAGVREPYLRNSPAVAQERTASTE